MHANTAVALKPNFMSFLLLCAPYFFKYTYSSKIPKDSLFIFLVLNAFFITVNHVKAVQDDISTKTVPI